MGRTSIRSSKSSASSRPPRRALGPPLRRPRGAGGASWRSVISSLSCSATCASSVAESVASRKKLSLRPALNWGQGASCRGNRTLAGRRGPRGGACPRVASSWPGRDTGSAPCRPPLCRGTGTTATLGYPTGRGRPPFRPLCPPKAPTGLLASSLGLGGFGRRCRERFCNVFLARFETARGTRTTRPLAQRNR
jgi:hypothetical protein